MCVCVREREFLLSMCVMVAFVYMCTEHYLCIHVLNTHTIRVLNTHTIRVNAKYAFEYV